MHIEHWKKKSHWTKNIINYVQKAIRCLIDNTVDWIEIQENFDKEQNFFFLTIFISFSLELELYSFQFLVNEIQ